MVTHNKNAALSSEGPQALKWILVEEGISASQYVAIMVSDRNRKWRMEQRKCSVYSDREEAYRRARMLGEVYGVKQIRVFHPDGNM